ALYRPAESKYLFAASTMGVQKIQTFLLRSLNVIGEAFVSFKLIAAGSFFGREHLFESSGNRLPSCVRNETDDRAAVDRRQITIEHCEAVSLKQRLDCLESVVEQMLVVDLIEREVLDDLFHVKELDDKNAVVLKTLANSIGDGMQFLEMEEHAGCIN